LKLMSHTPLGTTAVTVVAKFVYVTGDGIDDGPANAAPVPATRPTPDIVATTPKARIRNNQRLSLTSRTSDQEDLIIPAFSFTSAF
jgi:hypothetical protein